MQGGIICRVDWPQLLLLLLKALLQKAEVVLGLPSRSSDIFELMKEVPRWNPAFNNIIDEGFESFHLEPDFLCMARTACRSRTPAICGNIACFTGAGIDIGHRKGVDGRGYRDAKTNEKTRIKLKESSVSN